jgi:hypothetical protein
MAQTQEPYVNVRVGSKRVKLRLSDIRPHSYYDEKKILATEKHQTVTFFDTPSANLVRSNSLQANQIPNGFVFELRRIRICPVKATAEDLDRIIKNGVLTFKKGGSDEIFRKPLFEFATGGGVYTSKQDVDINSIGMPMDTAAASLPFSIFITGGTIFNFEMILDFQEPVETGGGSGPTKYLSGDTIVKLDLEGILRKPVLS